MNDETDLSRPAVPFAEASPPPSPVAAAAAPQTRARARAALLAAAVPVGWHVWVWTLPRWTWPPPEALGDVSWRYWLDLWTLVLAVLLVAPAPRRSGLVVGAIREHWRGVLLVCGVPIVLTAAVYPLLPTRPWAADASSMWTVSPAAQDLAFFGCVYRLLDGPFRGRVFRRCPVEAPLLGTSLLFAAWHAPNFLALPAGYVAFQLVYVFVGACVIGLARQWTGSLLYGWVVHTATNCIAWSVP